MKVEEIESVETQKQLIALKRTLKYVAAHSPFYQRHFSSNGLDINQIESISDLQLIPLVSKDDIQENALDFWAAHRDQIADYSNTSGTQGQPITVPLTENDLTRLGEVERQSFERAGIDASDVILLTTTVNRRFMAGLAYVMGARAIGAGLIRTGPGLIENQWKTIDELKPTAIIAVPSFIAKMIAYAEANGINVNASSVQKVICIGESIRNGDFSLNALGSFISSEWEVELFSTYASSEMQTAFTECSAHQGAHASSDLIVTEMIDEAGNPVPDGKPGELVVTTLGIEGFPLIRFRTGDICTKYTDNCTCGESGVRLGPVIGRLNQMIKAKGTTCYPPAISGVLDGFESISDYQIRLEKDVLNNDLVKVYFHASAGFSEKELVKEFQSKIRFTPELISVSHSEIAAMVHPEDSRKALHFLDLR